jgi:hypothetical protein
MPRVSQAAFLHCDQDGREQDIVASFRNRFSTGWISNRHLDLGTRDLGQPEFNQHRPLCVLVRPPRHRRIGKRAGLHARITTSRGSSQPLHPRRTTSFADRGHSPEHARRTEGVLTTEYGSRVPVLILSISSAIMSEGSRTLRQDAGRSVPRRVGSQFGNRAGRP